MPQQGWVMDFERIFAALFEQLKTVKGVIDNIRLTQPGVLQIAAMERGIKPWDKAPQQPAIFLRQGPQMGVHQPEQGLMVWTLHAEIYLYVKVPADAEIVAATYVNPLLAAIVSSLQPGLPGERQTLGGLVQNVGFEGEGAFVDPLYPDQQAIAVLPVSILTA